MVILFKILDLPAPYCKPKLSASAALLSYGRSLYPQRFSFLLPSTFFVLYLPLINVFSDVSFGLISSNTIYLFTVANPISNICDISLWLYPLLLLISCTLFLLHCTCSCLLFYNLAELKCSVLL